MRKNKIKRYKLKKDLPTFKAGDKFHISSDGELVLDNSWIIAYSKSTLEKFPNILTDWFEEIPEPSIRSRVAYGCIYYYVNSYGIVSCSYDYRNEDDNYLYGIGNYFKTEEEAEAYREYFLARQVLLDDANGGKFIRIERNYSGFYSEIDKEMEYVFLLWIPIRFNLL